MMSGRARDGEVLPAPFLAPAGSQILSSSSSQLCPLTTQPSRGRTRTVMVTVGQNHCPAEQGFKKHLWNQHVLPEGRAPSAQAPHTHAPPGLHRPAVPPPQPQTRLSPAFVMPCPLHQQELIPVSPNVWDTTTVKGGGSGIQ